MSQNILDFIRSCQTISIFECFKRIYTILTIRIQNIIISAPKDGNELRDLLFTATLNKAKPFTIRYPKEQSVNFEKKSPKKILIYFNENFIIINFNWVCF